MKITAFIERGDDDTYSVFIPDNPLPFGIFGDGDTVDEAINDFYDSLEEMKELFAEQKKEVPDVEFEFKYDMASFLGKYSKVLSLAGLGRLTGVNQKQLGHYITGHRRPSARTVKKIEESLHSFAKELSQVSFI